MNNLFKNTYDGKKVLVTGHTGFKGSWLSYWLTKIGAQVIGYSIDIPTNPNHFELLGLDIINITGDILDKEKLKNTINEHRPDIIFHMAAQSLVRKSYSTPVETFETNIMGTINILESCRNLDYPIAIVNITSDKCYQNKEQDDGYTEEDSMGGDDPYSASKGCSELIANSYRKSFFPKEKYGTDHHVLLADVRAGNVIGGGDWAEDRLIPDIMKATSLKKPSMIRNPDSIRPWQHVLDPLSGYLQLGAKLLNKEKNFSDNWNFGPDYNESLSVKKVVEIAKKFWEDIYYEIPGNKNNLHEAKILKLNSDKAKMELEWQSVWPSDKAIEKTTNWYKNYYTEKKITTEKDLVDYVNDAKILSIEWTK